MHTSAALFLNEKKSPISERAREKIGMEMDGWKKREKYCNYILIIFLNKGNAENMDLLQVAHSPIAVFILYLRSYMSKKRSSKFSHIIYWEKAHVLVLCNTAKIKSYFGWSSLN